MVSRRKLFSMVLMMVVIFVLFVFTQVYRNAVNDYDTNEYANEIAFQQEDAFQASDGDAKTDLKDRQVVLIGDEAQGFGSVAAQWCAYSKRSLRSFSSLKDYLFQKDRKEGILCIDPEYLSCTEDGKLLEKIYNQDMVIIFGGLPDIEELKNALELREALGIERVREESVKSVGIYVDKGFLLGGEAIYRADTEAEAVRQDLELNMPWFELGERTKTYIIGWIENEGIKREEQPAIVWRNTLGSTRVFAVNGNYMCDETGLGFLDAMMVESYPYALYPIVNAQNLSVVNYPSFASENEEAIQKIYSSSPRMLLQNIIWPNLILLSIQSGFKTTCFLTPQFFYSDENVPQADDLVYYLRQIKEQQGEVGWSAEGNGDTPAQEKWNEDKEFFEGARSAYVYTAAFAPGQRKDEILELNDKKTTAIRTIVGEREEGDYLLSYVSENITYQGITHRAENYNFSDDLRNRSLQTALGYTNILLDMRCVFLPESEEDHWENYSRQISENIVTWWKPFSSFDRTTATESDTRLRSFLALDYEDEQRDNRIELRVKDRDGKVYFLLRMYDKKIDSVSGGEFVKIEENTYLISVQEDKAEIYLTN